MLLSETKHQDTQKLFLEKYELNNKNNILSLINKQVKVNR